MTVSLSNTRPKRRPPTDADRCLLSDSALLSLSAPDAAGFLERRSNISGWYRYWFSLHGSQLLYFERAQFNRRGLHVGTISLFRHKLSFVNSFKRRREFEITDLSGKQHIFRADSDAELHWWIDILDSARNKIPPARPIAPPAATASTSTSSSSVSSSTTPSSSTNSTSANGHAISSLTTSSNTSQKSLSQVDGIAPSKKSPSTLIARKSNNTTPFVKHRPRPRQGFFASDESSYQPARPPPPPTFPNTIVDPHKPVDHVLCVVHGIGVDNETLSNNIRSLTESYAEIMSKVFPDLEFGVEILVVHWRNALTSLDMHRKLRAVVPRVPSFAPSTTSTASSTSPASRDISAPSPTNGQQTDGKVQHDDASSDDGNPLKHIMEHRVVDYVYYTYSRFRQHILREVCQQLNEAVRAFRRRRPEYTGGISVMGHSLGAALSYELLSKRAEDDQVLLESEGLRLEFDADNLFCLGSPLGTLLAMDPNLGGKQAGRALVDMSFRITNVFKYQDPIATRLEPLSDVEWARVPPVNVPCWTNMGLRESTAEWFGSWWTGTQGRGGSSSTTTNGVQSNGDVSEEANDKTDSSSKRKSWLSLNGSIGNGTTKETVVGTQNGETKTKAKSKPTGADEQGATADDAETESDKPTQAAQAVAESVGLGKEFTGRRLDFGLQVSSTMEEVSTSWSAYKSHSEYWGNRDAMLLLLSQMIKSCYGLDGDGDGAENGWVPEWGETERDSFPDVTVINEETAVRRLTDAAVQRRTRDESEHEALEVCVEKVVERLIEEAVATHELVRQHPGVKVGLAGGVGQKSKFGIGSGGPKNDNDGSSSKHPENGNSGTEAANGDTAVNSWASYLSRGWFGGGSSRNGTAASNNTSDGRVGVSDDRKQRDG